MFEATPGAHGQPHERPPASNRSACSAAARHRRHTPPLPPLIGSTAAPADLERPSHGSDHISLKNPFFHTSHLGGRFGYPNRSPYATTKRGLIAFAETLALELGGDGIRTNVIAPGAVEGDRIRRVLQGRAEASGRSLEEVTADALGIQAIKRFVDPADIAALAVFLASERAKSISGQTVPIDGDSQTAV